MLIEDSDYDEGSLLTPSIPRANQQLPKKQKMAMKKGHSAQWPEDVVDDLIDIICENESLKRKLNFTNNKLQRIKMHMRRF